MKVVSKKTAGGGSSSVRVVTCAYCDARNRADRLKCHNCGAPVGVAYKARAKYRRR